MHLAPLGGPRGFPGPEGRVGVSHTREGWSRGPRALQAIGCGWNAEGKGQPAESRPELGKWDPQDLPLNI